MSQRSVSMEPAAAAAEQRTWVARPRGGSMEPPGGVALADDAPQLSVSAEQRTAGALADGPQRSSSMEPMAGVARGTDGRSVTGAPAAGGAFADDGSQRGRSLEPVSGVALALAPAAAAQRARVELGADGRSVCTAPAAEVALEPAAVAAKQRARVEVGADGRERSVSVEPATAAADQRTWVALAADGRRVAWLVDGELRLDGRTVLSDPGLARVAAVDRAMWAVATSGGGALLHRVGADGVALPPVALGELGPDVRIAASRRGARCALIEGTAAVLVRETRGAVAVAVEALGAVTADRRILADDRGLAERRGEMVTLRSGGAGFVLPADLRSAAVVAGGAVFDGAALFAVLEHRDRRTLLVGDLRARTVRTRIRLGDGEVLAVAESRGLVVLGQGPHIALLDLRAGRCIGERALPAPIACAAIDRSGERLIVVDTAGRAHELGAALRDAAPGAAAEVAPEAVATPPPPPAIAAPEAVATPSPPPSPPPPAIAAPAVPTPAAHSPIASAPAAPAPTAVAPTAPAPTPAAPTPAAPEAPAPTAVAPPLSSPAATAPAATAPAATAPAATAPPAVASPLAAPTAAASIAPMAIATAPEVVALAVVDAGLDEPLRAIQAPGSGARLDRDDLDAYLEDVRALMAAYALTAAGRADAKAEGAARARFRTWHRPGAPHVEVAAELGLSSLAMSILWFAAAPLVWGELARAYGEARGDAARPLVDEHLIAQLLEADAETRLRLARELDDDAPLRRHGAIEVGPGTRPFAAITVHPALVRRLAGETFDEAGDAREPTAELEGIRAPGGELAAAAAVLARPWPGPVRLALRGPRGSGRRTIAAALAARAGRRLGLVEIAAGTPPSAREAELRRGLRDVALRGWIPCVTVEPAGEEPHEHERLRAVIAAHPGPVFERVGPRATPLAGADHHAIELRVLDETGRRDAWRELLAANGLAADAADGLAARHAVGPGVMARAVAQARPDDPAGAEAAIAAALRRHRGGTIGEVATRVVRLATWRDLVLPEELDTSLRGLVARVRRRRTVLETWGMDRVATTARGVTALFQGGPGTGKTMAAGAIARELGWELWRVDLSRVMSRWLGETERQLARVFDAAEAGEIVLLFDEADSLFGKRTDVKSANDRYANLEVNYLLQRLDDFGGVAILTTNFGAAIDAAVRRRLSAEIQFPFPDETERERLWRVHLPASVPGAAALDLSGVARRYQLSGGYIRNAALRACFQAADDEAPLTLAHVAAAVEAEYRDRARVGVGGRID